MHKNIKKIITGIAAIAIMATMITPIGVSARTYNAGTLFWDFESTDDIGYFNHANNTSQIVVADTSGAWVKEYVPNTENTSWCFRVLSAAHTAVTTAAALENGGNQCLMVDGGMENSNSSVTSVGACILLADKELVPGRQYNVSFDILGTSTYREAAYVAVSKPSAYDTGGDSPTWRSRIPWLEEGNGYYVKATTETNVGPINTQWDHQSVMFAAPESLYENGFIRLHIAVANLDDGQKGGDVYLDNISISPIEISQNKTSYAKLRYGKVWDFEEGVNVAHDDNIGLESNVMGTYAEGKWAPIDDNKVVGTAPYFVPRYLTKATTLTNMASGHDGVPAFGGNLCLATTSNIPGSYDWSDTTNGAKILLSEEDFPAGTYTLSMLAGSNKSRKRSINASVFRGTANIPTKDYTAVTSALANATQTYNMGKFGDWWGRYTATITLDENDYDENGNFTLVIHIDNAGMANNEHLYLDDISLYTEERTIAAGDKVNFFVTTVSDAPISNILSLAATKEGYALKDCDVSETSVSAIDTKNYTVQIPSGVTNPEFKLYMWNKTTLEPLALPMD